MALYRCNPLRFRAPLLAHKGGCQTCGPRSSTMRSALHLMINLGDSVDDSRAEAKRFLDTYYGINTQDETMDAGGSYGSPRTRCERILEYIDNGLDIPILRFASFSQDTQFERCTEELLPMIREMSGA